MFYIIRHGRTDWNDLKKLQGRTDIPLNESGIAMAKAAHDEYLNIHFDICYCSPLKRAVQTAELLLEGRDVPIVVDERLAEICFGVYEGIENSFEIPDCPINTIFFEPEKYRGVEGGETLDEIFERVDSFLKEKVYCEADKDILVVGHGGINSAITTAYKKMPVEKFWSEGIENCKLKVLG